MIDEAAPHYNLTESESLTIAHLLCVLLDPFSQDGLLYFSSLFFYRSLSLGLYSLCLQEVTETEIGQKFGLAPSHYAMTTVGQC